MHELKNLNYAQQGRNVENNDDNQNNKIYTTTGDNKVTIRRKGLKSEEGGIKHPIHILKLRLAKGEITKNEYNELYNAISSK